MLTQMSNRCNSNKRAARAVLHSSRCEKQCNVRYFQMQSDYSLKRKRSEAVKVILQRNAQIIHALHGMSDPLSFGVPARSQLLLFFCNVGGG